MQIEIALTSDRWRYQKYAENFTFQQFWSNFPVKFPFFLKSSLILNSFYCLFILQTKP